MKTQVNRHRVGTIEEFADEYGLEMVVDETNVSADNSCRYEAYFRGCLAALRGLCVPCVPDKMTALGETPAKAIAKYARRISCQWLYLPGDRKAIPVWRLDEKPAEPTPRITIESIDKGFMARLTEWIMKNPTVYPSTTILFEHCTSSSEPSAEGTAGETIEVPPQPEIAPCLVCGTVATVRGTTHKHVQCKTPYCIIGPQCKAEAEAIAAWNKLAGRAEG